MAIVNNQYRAHKIKSLISKGKTKLALDLLYEYCLDQPSLYDTALLLYNGIINLEQDLNTGAISKNDGQILERKLIDEAITLANQLSQIGVPPGTDQRSAIPNTPYVYPPFYKMKLEPTWSMIVVISIIMIWLFHKSCN